MVDVDVTLFGATGYTGELTALYLGTHLPAGASWAVAGRNLEKLKAVSDRVVAAGGVAPELVTADVADESSMTAMARGTRVLVSTVGPYLRFGDAAVKAAAEAGIGYLDLTGEPQFVDETWLRHHQTAATTGAVLVHACGFDSLPYDLGVLHAMELAQPSGPATVRGFVRANIQPSGGTLHSALTQFGSLRESARVAQARRRQESRPAHRRVHGAGSFGRADHDRGWKVPLPTIDPQVVLRSARALDLYGPDFTYEHFAHVKTVRMLALGAVGVGAVGLAAQVPPVRRLLLNRIDPGSGPTPESREKAWFRLDLLTEADGRTQHTRVSGKDPGYGGTAQMLSEAALCLAFDDVPTRVPGQTTSAVALGHALIERLDPQIMRFETL